ncbi:MAG: hypothetical protein MJ252_07320 [archaeon]|nr:hypothetical protein [archaeon]
MAKISEIIFITVLLLTNSVRIDQHQSQSLTGQQNQQKTQFEQKAIQQKAQIPANTPYIINEYGGSVISGPSQSLSEEEVISDLQSVLRSMPEEDAKQLAGFFEGSYKLNDKEQLRVIKFTQNKATGTEKCSPILGKDILIIQKEKIITPQSCQLPEEEEETQKVQEEEAENVPEQELKEQPKEEKETEEKKEEEKETEEMQESQSAVQQIIQVQPEEEKETEENKPQNEEAVEEKEQPKEMPKEEEKETEEEKVTQEVLSQQIATEEEEEEKPKCHGKKCEKVIVDAPVIVEAVFLEEEEEEEKKQEPEQPQPPESTPPEPVEEEMEEQKEQASFLNINLFLAK